MTTEFSGHESIPSSLAQNAEPFKDLASIFNPLGELAAAHILNSTQAERDEDYRRLNAIKAHRVSYRPEYALLPPMLFGNKRRPQLPKNDDDQHKIIDRFARAMHSGTLAEREYYAPTRDRADDPIFGTNGVSRTLRRYRDRLTLDPEGWQQYRNTYIQHRKSGTERNMLELLAYRSREVQKHTGLFVSDHMQRLLHRFSGRFDSFLYAPLNLGHPPELEVPPAVVVPIGEYGPEPAYKLLRATVITAEKLGSIITAQAATLAAENPKLIRERTARGGSEYKFRAMVTAASLVSTMQEGVVGNQHAISQLTAVKVPGYEDPDQLLRDITEKRVLERYTQKSSMGVVANLTLHGLYFENPLDNLGGGPDLSENQLAVLAEFKKHDVAEALAEMDRAYDRQRIAPDEPMALVGVQKRTGIMCPAAVKNGAVDRIARILLHYYQML